MDYLIIKFGGSILEQLPDSYYEEIINLQLTQKTKPVIVHGGGPLISKLLGELNIETSFINGLRKTTQEVLDIVEMVLSGTVNKLVVRKLTQANGKAVGLSGVDGQLLLSRSLNYPDLGFVGQVENVNVTLLSSLISQGYIPVISPVGIDKDGTKFNINGDLAAAAIAKALGGKLCFVSNIPGIYIEEHGVRTVLQKVNKNDVNNLINNGFIKEGMIPKISAALDALHHNVPEVTIMSGSKKFALTRVANGEAVGTTITL